MVLPGVHAMEAVPTNDGPGVGTLMVIVPDLPVCPEHREIGPLNVVEDGPLVAAANIPRHVM